jgi:hypothetical protein
MSDSRQEILQAIRQKAPPAIELPGADVPAVTYPDPQQQFIERLKGVGGHAVVVAERLRVAVADLSLRRLAPAAPDHVTISIGVATALPRRDLDLAATVPLGESATLAFVIWARAGRCGIGAGTPPRATRRAALLAPAKCPYAIW